MALLSVVLMVAHAKAAGRSVKGASGLRPFLSWAYLEVRLAGITYGLLWGHEGSPSIRGCVPQTGLKGVYIRSGALRRDCFESGVLNLSGVHARMSFRKMLIGGDYTGAFGFRARAYR